MDNYPNVDTMEERLVFSAIFSLHKTLMSLDLQEFKSKINIKKEFKFSLGFVFHLEVIEKVFGGMLSGDRL